MHKLMVGLMSAVLGFAMLAPEPASAQRWNGSGWNYGGSRGHQGGWSGHRRCRTQWINGRRITRCWYDAALNWSRAEQTRHVTSHRRFFVLRFVRSERFREWHGIDLARS
ncbi:hypothetical protein Msil_2793 [Methylocella silvestris BL2]|uniref:Uncharacterized protein n=1 Tax=Methylocella silvestris (strain DSM 15510 / CIP 108128 / LMG 27833 / NCIMB 13906 / BL2) TaxID=395965 RepID=B8ES14_METSB|nr:hypothetical protein Msil_2793 [Methylocella silvestris BL2]